MKNELLKALRQSASVKLADYVEYYSLCRVDIDVIVAPKGSIAFITVADSCMDADTEEVVNFFKLYYISRIGSLRVKSEEGRIRTLSPSFF